MDLTLLNDSSNWEAIVEHFDNLRCTAKHPVFYFTGQAGTGKSYVLNNAMARDPKFAQLAATTGIAALNIDATTIHRVLGFRDTDSLYDAYQSGLVCKRLRMVRKYFRFLVIDEVSMMPYQQLDMILWALDEINADVEDADRLGLILVGDMAQLPPIPGDLIVKGKRVPTKVANKFVREPTPWIFKSELWPRFEEPGHMIKLEKIWRQSDQTFLNGINAVRKGLGTTGVGYLVAAGVEFTRELDQYFEGTTIVGKNEEVDRVNKFRLSKLPGQKYEIPSTRWWLSEFKPKAAQPNGWNNIPPVLELKLDAYVMLLVNSKDPITGEMIWANGDCGWVREVIETRVPIYGESTYFDPNKPEVDYRPIIGETVTYAVKVELVRDPGNTVTVPMLTRMDESRYAPDEDLRTHPKFPQEKVRNSMGRLVWCLGELTFMPLRLAYASTCHKVQGLTLNRVQIDPRDAFFKSPGMAYVSLTRGRTPEGIKIVGNSSLFAERVKLDEAVRRFV